MMIPQEKIDEIRERADIAQIISEYLHLRKAGRNHVGLCPFHSEKTPSFTVNNEKQIFYCFGCNTGGNIFTFLMKQENLSFPEAVRAVAKRVGIEIPLDKKPSGDEDRREPIFSANHAAAEFYHQCLLTSQEAGNAREYVKGRGLQLEIIKSFKVGYAPPNWDSLSKFLAKKGISLETAEKAGLVNRKERGFYDRFRGRVMFPITDVRNRVIGFGGRSLGEEAPKYLNSPNSPLFKKGEVLYGMHQAKNSVAGKGFALVVEGYFDLLMLHQHGFSNTVATLGTALTQEHLRRLKGYAKEVYILFDSDSAGKQAAMRSMPLLIEEDIPGRVVFMPAGIDPDDLLNKEGAQGMARCIQDAKPIMEFFINSAREKLDTEDAKKKVAFLEEVSPYVAKIKNIIEKDIYVEKIAGILHIGPEIVLSAVKGAGRSGAGEQKYKTNAADEIMGKGNTARAEETILKIILSYPEMYNEQVKITMEMFNTDFLREAGMLIADALQKRLQRPETDPNGTGKIDLSAITDSAASDKAKTWLLRASLEEDDSIKVEPKKQLEDCLKRVLMTSRLKKEASILLKRLSDAEKRGDMESFRTLAESYQSMKRDI